MKRKKEFLSPLTYKGVRRSSAPSSPEAVIAAERAFKRAVSLQSPVPASHSTIAVTRSCCTVQTGAQAVSSISGQPFVTARSHPQCADSSGSCDTSSTSDTSNSSDTIGDVTSGTSSMQTPSIHSSSAETSNFAGSYDIPAPSAQTTTISSSSSQAPCVYSSSGRNHSTNSLLLE